MKQQQQKVTLSLLPSTATRENASSLLCRVTFSFGAEPGEATLREVDRIIRAHHSRNPDHHVWMDDAEGAFIRGLSAHGNGMFRQADVLCHLVTVDETDKKITRAEFVRSLPVGTLVRLLTMSHGRQLRTVTEHKSKQIVFRENHRDGRNSYLSLQTGESYYRAASGNLKLVVNGSGPALEYEILPAP